MRQNEPRRTLRERQRGKEALPLRSAHPQRVVCSEAVVYSLLNFPLASSLAILRPVVLSGSPVNPKVSAERWRPLNAAGFEESGSAKRHSSVMRKRVTPCFQCGERCARWDLQAGLVRRLCASRQESLARCRSCPTELEYAENPTARPTARRRPRPRTSTLPRRRMMRPLADTSSNCVPFRWLLECDPASLCRRAVRELATGHSSHRGDARQRRPAAQLHQGPG